MTLLLAVVASIWMLVTGEAWPAAVVVSVALVTQMYAALPEASEEDDTVQLTPAIGFSMEQYDDYEEYEERKIGFGK